MNVTFTLPKGGTFDAFIGEKIVDGRSGPLHEARRLSEMMIHQGWHDPV